MSPHILKQSSGSEKLALVLDKVTEKGDQWFNATMENHFPNVDPMVVKTQLWAVVEYLNVKPDRINSTEEFSQRLWEHVNQVSGGEADIVILCLLTSPLHFPDLRHPH